MKGSRCEKLWQVGTLDRGTLSGGNIGSKVFGQGWTYDQTGNWANFKQDNNGNGTWDLNQNRSHNTSNEITSIQVWGAVAHDAMGNMTRIPKPSALASRYACVWDAWNRLVEVKETDGSGNPTSTVATYRYDGFWRRTKKVIGASTRDYYYSLGWQVLEERVGGTLDRQFVWGIRHIDDLVLRDRGVERLYAVHDAMHVTAVVNDSGAVQERYGYDGFGRPRIMTAAFAPQDPTTRDWETLFDGYRYDRETGLYQVRFRYLHPELGRWISRDVIGELAGENLYRCVWNRPSLGPDPFGLLWPILAKLLLLAAIAATLRQIYKAVRGIVEGARRAYEFGRRRRDELEYQATDAAQVYCQTCDRPHAFLACPTQLADLRQPLRDIVEMPGQTPSAGGPLPTEPADAVASGIQWLLQQLAELIRRRRPRPEEDADQDPSDPRELPRDRNLMLAFTSYGVMDIQSRHSRWIGPSSEELAGCMLKSQFRPSREFRDFAPVLQADKYAAC